MVSKGKNFISGRWRPASGHELASSDPATGDLIWQGRSSSAHDIQFAFDSAHDAFTNWSKRSFDERIEFILAYKDCLTKAIDRLAMTIAQETGKPLWESRNEVQTMINKVDISIEAHKARCEEIIRQQANARAITRHKPHGVVAVLGPYNFPGHLPNGHIVPALIAGNTVIFKPSELTPSVGEAMTECWEKAGLPEGVLNLVQGGHESGKHLANHPGINGLFFTGSWNTGQQLLAHFSQHPEKILALEMGGNNPIIAWDVSDLKAAAYTIIQSAYLTSGQRCTCARRLIISNESQGNKLLQELINMIKKIKIGPFTGSPEPFMGPVISERAAKGIMEAQEKLKSLGGTPLVEMQLLGSGTGFITPGLMDVSLILNVPDEEVFGPFLQVIRTGSFNQALKIANDTAYGLSAGLLSDKEDYYQQFQQTIRAGIVNWNTPTTGASSSAPFGGIGLSGNHRPSAYYAADYCSYPVASLENNELKIPQTLTPGIDIETSTVTK